MWSDDQDDHGHSFYCYSKLLLQLLVTFTQTRILVASGISCEGKGGFFRTPVLSVSNQLPQTSVQDLFCSR